MVTITGWKQLKNAEGKEYISLEVQGGIEFVQSQATGKFYATTRKCLMPSTFNEDIAKQLVGTVLPGEVNRVKCDPYEYIVPSTGEIILLNYRYEYCPEHVIPEQEKAVQNKEQIVISEEMAEPEL